MNVLLLTVFLSLLLAVVFIACFIWSRRCAEFSSPESDALLPLKDEQLRAVDHTDA